MGILGDARPRESELLGALQVRRSSWRSSVGTVMPSARNRWAAGYSRSMFPTAVANKSV